MRAEGTGWVSNAGVAMPRILYGTAWKKERTAGLVEQALKAGFRGLDTAGQPRHYHEPGVGEGLARALAAGLPRDAVYVQTKFTPLGGHDPARIPYDPSAPPATQVRQSFEGSLRNLGVERLDGLVLHSPIGDPAQFRAVWGAMEDIALAGGTRQLGISNCYEPQVLRQLWEEARVKPALVQNRFYDQTGYDRAVRHYCRQHGMVYQSFWTLTANPHLLAHPVVAGLAGRQGRTAPQILFAALSAMGIIPLTGTGSAQHMAEDLAAFEPPLSAPEVEAVMAILG